MSVVLPKSTLYQILFALAIGVLYVQSYELTFSVWVLITLVTLKTKYSKDIFQYLLCFIAIFSIATVVLFFHNDYKAYFVIRDITYVIKPILGILIGYQLCEHNFKKAFQTIIFVGVLISIYHLCVLGTAVVFYHVTKVNGLREWGGYFSDYEVYVLILLLFHKKFELGFSKNKLLIFTVIVGFSSFMYLSRTNFIQFVILFLAMKGYFKINKTSITVVSSIIAFTLIGYSTILYINPKRNGPGLEALLYKIKIAPTEPFKTKIDADDWKDFNDNYRSYENIHTVKQVTRKGTPTMLFGEGFGSRIDLKREVWLGDMFLRYISILHNGFMTVFLKSGLLGIAIYLYSIYLLFVRKKSKIPQVSNLNLLLLGTGIFLIFSNWVFLGVYNLLDNKSILIGFFICYQEVANKKNKSENLVHE